MALLILSCLYGCNQDDRVEDKPTETTTDTDKTEPSLIEQTESDYIISADWMTFYFSKKDFKESDVEDIAEEAKNSRKPVTNSSISGYFTTSGDGYNSVTEVNGVYYKNFKLE